jgi:acetolactate synthase-1/2/3 large subunit
LIDRDATEITMHPVTAPQSTAAPADRRTTVAESFLRALKDQGIDYVFANAGTDFAPVIEGLVSLANDPGATPTFLTIPHENLAVAMAHGYYLVSGKPAAAMVHVTVGTGNSVCALMNAYRDNVPLLLMAGRTPHTQIGHIASRSFPIHWGQENFDQAGMVREYTKWDYELRAGQAVEEIIARGLEIAAAQPRGPVYLTLPREVLADIDQPRPPRPAAGTVAKPQPSAAHIATAARWIAEASWPMIVTSHLGRDHAAVAALAALAETFAIPVAQAAPSCVNLPASHSMNLGQSGGALLQKADVIVVIDSEVPWFPRNFTPGANTKVVHLGADPLYVRYPIRSFPTDLAVPGHAQTALALLAEELSRASMNQSALRQRRTAVAEFQDGRRARAAAALESARTAKPISYSYVGACVRDVLPRGGIVVSELGIASDQLALEEPGSLIGVGLGGGLGFGLGASLGAKLAAPDKTVISTIGDGSYMFGNPTPFHFVARAAQLPVLTIICNNNRWHAVDAATRGVYPHGLAAASPVMPLVELKPSPEFCKVAEASDAFARRVDDPADLPGALEAALRAIESGQQALLDVQMEHGRRSEG